MASILVNEIKQKRTEKQNKIKIHNQNKAIAIYRNMLKESGLQTDFLDDPKTTFEYKIEITKALFDGLDIHEFDNLTTLSQVRTKRMDILINKDFKKFMATEFDKEKQKIFIDAHKQGLDIQYLVSPDLSVDQLLTLVDLMGGGVDIREIIDPKLNTEQMHVLGKAKKNGVDISDINNPKYSSAKMRLFVEAKRKGIDFSSLLEDEYDTGQIMVLCDALCYVSETSLSDVQKKGLKIIFDPAIEEPEMAALFDGITRNVNIVEIASGGYEYEQIEVLISGLEAGLSICWYDNIEYDSDQMQIIFDGLLYEKEKGLKEGSVVSKYASIGFDDDQMNEIFKGVISGVDVEAYNSPKNSFEKMREARLNLEDKIVTLENPYFVNEGTFAMTKKRKIKEAGLLLDDISGFAIDPGIVSKYILRKRNV